MNSRQTLRTIVSAAFVASLSTAASPVLVAEQTSFPALVPAVKITSLFGSLLDAEGNALAVGSEIREGARVKTANGETARVVLSQGGSSSGIIGIEPNSEVEFMKFSPSTDADYPLLDTEISLRSAQVRADTKRIF